MSRRALVTIPQEDYETLVEESMILHTLHEHGVENWEGWSHACRAHFENNDDES